MDRRVWTTLAVVGALGALVVVAVFVLGRNLDGGGSDQGAAASSGQVFDIDRGDPVDVTLRTGPKRCIAIAGDPYLTSTYCPPNATVRSGRAFAVAAPVEGDGPVLVIGFVPRGRTRAIVSAGSSQATADVRSPLFLGSLPASALGAEGSETVTVEFG